MNEFSHLDQSEAAGFQLNTGNTVDSEDQTINRQEETQQLSLEFGKVTAETEIAPLEVLPIHYNPDLDESSLPNIDQSAGQISTDEQAQENVTSSAEGAHAVTDLTSGDLGDEIAQATLSLNPDVYASDGSQTVITAGEQVNQEQSDVDTSLTPEQKRAALLAEPMAPRIQESGIYKKYRLLGQEIIAEKHGVAVGSPEMAQLEVTLKLDAIVEKQLREDQPELAAMYDQQEAAQLRLQAHEQALVDIKAMLPTDPTLREKAVTSNPFSQDLDYNQATVAVTDLTTELAQAANKQEWLSQNRDRVDTLLIQVVELNIDGANRTTLSDAEVELVKELRRADGEQQVTTMVDSLNLVLEMPEGAAAPEIMQHKVEEMLQTGEVNGQMIDQEALEKVVLKNAQDIKEGKPVVEAGPMQAVMMGLFILLDLRNGGHFTSELMLQWADNRFQLSDKLAKMTGLTPEQIRSGFFHSGFEGSALLVNKLEKTPTDKVEEFILNRNGIELFNLLSKINRLDRISLISGHVPEKWSMQRGLRPEVIQHVYTQLGPVNAQQLELPPAPSQQTALGG